MIRTNSFHTAIAAWLNASVEVEMVFACLPGAKGNRLRPTNVGVCKLNALLCGFFVFWHEATSGLPVHRVPCTRRGSVACRI